MDDPTTFTLTALSGLLATLTLSTALSPTPTSPPLTHPAPPLDLRTFTARELRALPGVGERRAIDILRARATHAISGTVDSLDRVPGIGPGTVDSIRAELTCRARVHASLPHAAPHTTEPAP